MTTWGWSQAGGRIIIGSGKQRLLFKRSLERLAFHSAPTPINKPANQRRFQCCDRLNTLASP